ncbi:MAG: arylsulfatase A family protein [Opitutia bacterium Tous-C1TDCM]|nr:MAG: arylsulfatase A family protein [Opitutae bacterium Tous-C1TDCM]
MKLIRCLFLMVACAVAPGLRAAERPHLVIFISDDHTRLDSTVYGSRDVRTPHMDRVAAAGLTFDRAFVASPSCAPSRAALLTGLMPARNGAEANHSKPRAELKKLPAYLQELGYEVVSFGKVSHYRHTADYGFDHGANDTFHDAEAIPAALKWLRERKGGRPLCLFVGTNWPHVPWPLTGEGYKPGDVMVPPGHVDTPVTREARARYYAAVARMDQDLGAVYDAANAVLGTNLVFLATADHGAQWPMSKWSCYDAGIRTPLLAVWPGKIRPGQRTDAMVSWVDILPTLVELGGGKPAAELDGRSFAAVLTEPARAHRDRIFTTHSSDGQMNIYPIRSVRTADFKYIRNLHPEFYYSTHVDLAQPVDGALYYASWREAGKTDPAAAAIVARYHVRPAEELYDLRNDPHEQKNLAADPAHAARLAALRAELDAWMRAQGDEGKVYGKPRLLTDPERDKPPAKAAAKKKK